MTTALYIAVTIITILIMIIIGLIVTLRDVSRESWPNPEPDPKGGVMGDVLAARINARTIMSRFEIEAMLVTNRERVSLGHTEAWDEGAFMESRSELVADIAEIMESAQ
jgi:hypothetical protein